MIWRRNCVLVLVLASWFFSGVAHAEEGGEANSSRTRFSAAESLEAGIRSLGGEADLMDLLRSLDPGKREAIPGELESRFSALAEEHGVFAAPLAGFVNSELRSVPLPAILRVRPAIDAEEADHFVLIEAFENGNAQIVARRQSLRASLEDLSRLWSGHGVVLSREPLPQEWVSPAHTRLPWGYLGAAVAGLLAIWIGIASRPRALKRGSELRTAARDASSLILAAGCLTGASWTLWASQPIADAQGLAEGKTGVAIDFRDEAAPVAAHEAQDLSADDLKRLLASDYVLWVDARSQEEYDKGHITGAICLPKFDAATIRLRLAGISPDQGIVVYCVNAACPRGRAAATALTKAGFTNVAHYPAGWSDLQSWKELRRPETTDADRVTAPGSEGGNQ